MSALKPSIIFIGNCNAGVLRNVFSSLGAITDQYELFYTPALAQEQIHAGVQSVFARCAICFLQVNRDIKHFTDQIVPQLPAGCRIIRFPPAMMAALWPFEVADPRNPKSASAILPEGAYPASLSIRPVLQSILGGTDPNKAAEQYIAMDQVAELDRVLELSIANLRNIEQTCDIRIATYILDHFGRKRLFISSTHPAGTLFGEMTRQMADATGIKIAPSAIQALIDELDGFIGVGAYDAPVHPAVARFFGIEWADGLRYRHFHEGRFSHDEFVHRYAHFTYTPDYYIGRLLMENRAAREAVPYLESAIAINPTSVKFHHVLFQAALVLHDPMRLVQIAQRATTACPTDPQLWVNLANAAFDIGDLDAAGQACDQVLALSPDRSEIWRLGSHIFARRNMPNEANYMARMASWYESLDAAKRPFVADTGAEYGRHWIEYGRNGF
jgi:tetratricopeptide (TPR) repeat protein